MLSLHPTLLKVTAPPPHPLSCNVVRSVSCPLTVLVDPKSLGILLWLELEQQMCGVCDNQRAAVLQHHPAGVATYCWVHAATLRPGGRD